MHHLGIPKSRPSNNVVCLLTFRRNVKSWGSRKIDETSPFFLVNLCQHQNKKNVMSTIMKTMIISSFLCIFAKYINREKCILFDNLNNGKRQNDVERCNTTCSCKVELPCIERPIYVLISGFLRYGVCYVNIHGTLILHQ